MTPFGDLPPSVRLIGIGWYVAFCIIFGVVGGVLLDSWLDTRPYLTLLGLAFGLISAFWGGYRQLSNVLAQITSEGRHRRKGDKAE
jgi:F0F1-type ATP synthase assembly protein I